MSNIIGNPDVRKKRTLMQAYIVHKVYPCHWCRRPENNYCKQNNFKKPQTRTRSKAARSAWTKCELRFQLSMSSCVLCA